MLVVQLDGVLWGIKYSVIQIINEHQILIAFVISYSDKNLPSYSWKSVKQTIIDVLC